MNPQQHITDARNALATADRFTSSDPIAVIADLAAIAELVGRLTEQASQDLASWATVSPHLAQARDHAAVLSRNLRNAGGILAYNTSLHAVA
ncbi:hypothetical protein [Saccharopolyspora sp. 5N708]|uniref:hypothetical protein n=1 Tax=Saccharopolyspora sp. 5N708 TaxID=3457424 RepID=UPI003FD1BC76